uniref:Uncharacterized protein n=1 Tax=Molossus molossus TaxID=27622 RepID=A0A7J8DQF1_MOLMO|nr:hypothetical protein HJG59_009272 [Molossus molossus]
MQGALGEKASLFIVQLVCEHPGLRTGFQWVASPLRKQRFLAPNPNQKTRPKDNPVKTGFISHVSVCSLCYLLNCLILLNCLHFCLNFQLCYLFRKENMCTRAEVTAWSHYKGLGRDQYNAQGGYIGEDRVAGIVLTCSPREVLRKGFSDHSIKPH